MEIAIASAIPIIIPAPAIPAMAPAPAIPIIAAVHKSPDPVFVIVATVTIAGIIAIAMGIVTAIKSAARNFPMV